MLYLINNLSIKQSKDDKEKRSGFPIQVFAFHKMNSKDWSR